MINAALYLRRSTNERLQADSLRVQEQILRRYAREHDLRVIHVYRDSASGTSVRRRPEFLEMVARITRRHDFDVVLVRDVSRFGRFMDPDESAYWSYLFELHGVKTIYCEEMFEEDTSPVAGLIKSARRVMAAEYSRERARVVSGSQARVTRLGFFRGGPPPYGMKRILVTRGGEHLQDLEPGEWKALATHRIKLAPGDERQVEIVRKIFRMYSRCGSMAEVTRGLNRERIAPPQGTQWCVPTVRAMLANAAYAGRAVVTQSVRALPGREAETCRIEQPGSYEPLIDEELWSKVQTQLQAGTRHRTNVELANDLRRVYELTGVIHKQTDSPLLRLCRWDAYTLRFREGHQEALQLAYAAEFQKVRESVRELLFRAVDASEVAGDLFEVGRAALVELKFSFLRTWQAQIRWRFRSTGSADILLGVGVRTEPLRIEEMYVVLTRRRAKLLHIRIDGTAKRRPIRSEAELRQSLRWLIHGTSMAERSFLDAVRAKPLTNLSRIAKDLGWAERAVNRMYHRLLRRGCPMPPLRYKPGRRVRVICEGCGRTKEVTPPRALVLRGSLCIECVRARPTHKILVTCPSCGKASWRWPNQVRKLSNSASTPCKVCSLRSLQRSRRGVE